MNATPTPPAPDDFGDRLSASLHSGYDAKYVDVTALRDGARATSRRMRRRRTVGVALVAVATVAVPAGVVTALATQPSRGGVSVAASPDGTPSPDATASPSPTDVPTLTPSPTGTASATDSPAPTTSQATAAADPTPTRAAASPDPSPSGAASEPVEARRRPSARPYATSDPNSVAYPVPDSLAVSTEVFPVRVVEGFMSEQYRYQPTVPGQACDGGDLPRPVAGRQWTWYDPKTQFSVAEVVTGWKAGTGPDRFAEIAADTGDCHWLDKPRVLTATDDRWMGLEQRGKLSFARGAVRVGDVIVGIEVQHHDGLDAAEALLRRLLEQARERAVAW
ncbi:MAG: hypothetical protein U0Q15_02315 [Kineosporiaceae bacterium]